MTLLILMIGTGGQPAAAAQVQLQIPELGFDRAVPVSGRTPATTRLSFVGDLESPAPDFWADLAPGWELRLRRPGGGWQSFEVTGSAIVADPQVGGELDSPGDGQSRLTLVVPYLTARGAARGPLHYLVFAEAIGEMAEN